MFKNILQIYSLIVCIICTIIILIISANSLDRITDIVIPQYKFVPSSKYLDNATYKDYYHSTTKDLTDIEIDKRRLIEQKHEFNNFKAYSIRSLINLFCWLIPALITLIIHWRLYKKSSNYNNQLL